MKYLVSRYGHFYRHLRHSIVLCDHYDFFQLATFYTIENLLKLLNYFTFAYLIVQKVNFLYLSVWKYKVNLKKCKNIHVSKITSKLSRQALGKVNCPVKFLYPTQTLKTDVYK